MFLPPPIALRNGGLPIRRADRGRASPQGRDAANSERTPGRDISPQSRPDRHYANRSLSTAEPVSASPKRKLENGEQRPAPETRTQRMEMPEIARQRPALAGLS